MGLMMWVLACVLIGNGADVITTRVALRLGAYEQNPVVRRSVLLAKLLGTIVQFVMLVLAPPFWQAVGVSVILVFYLGVAAWNIRAIRRLLAHDETHISDAHRATLEDV